MTTLICAAVVLLALYLAFKLLESLLKVVMWALVLVAGYWLVAPSMGWPPLPDLLHLAWLDIERFAPGEWLDSLRDLLRVALD